MIEGIAVQSKNSFTGERVKGTTVESNRKKNQGMGMETLLMNGQMDNGGTGRFFSKHIVVYVHKSRHGLNGREFRAHQS